MADGRSQAESPIQCLLLPAGLLPLLMPSACIAEVISSPLIEEAPAAADWLAGYTIWRGQRIPVVSWEELHSGVEANSNHRLRAAVMNPMPDTAGPGYWAMLCRGDIQPIPIHSHSAESNLPTGYDPVYISATVTLQEDTAIIPDMTALGMLLRVL